MLFLLLLMAGAEKAWATDYYDILYGTPTYGGSAINGVNVQTDFSDTYAVTNNFADGNGNADLNLSGSMLATSTAANWWKYFNSAKANGKVYFSGVYRIAANTDQRIRIVDSSGNIIFGTAQNNSSSNATQVVAYLCGEEISCYVRQPRAAGYGVDLCIDLDNKTVDYTLLVSSGNGTTTTLTGQVSMPYDDVRGIYFAKASGSGYITYLDNVRLYHVITKHSYTVSNSLGATLATGEENDGATVITPYPRYALNGTTLYKVPNRESTDPHYGRRFTVTTDNQVETITYNWHAENIVSYREAEDFLTPVANNNNIYNRCSGTGGGYNAAYTDVASPSGGAYRITAASYANTSTSFRFKVGDNEVFMHTGTGGWSETTSGTFQVTDGQAIQVAGGSNNYALDYVYILRIFGYVYAASNQQYNDANIKPTVIAPDGVTVTYESNNKAVATVGSDGSITMHHNGVAVITAKATIDGVEYTSTRTLYVGGEPEATATFSPASPTTTETFTITGTGYLSETKEGQWIKVGFGNTSETQMVETVGGLSGLRGMDTNGYSHVYAENGLPSMGSYFVFTPKVNGKLTFKGYMTAANGIRLVDVDGNIMEKIAATDVTVNGWKDYAFNTLLAKGATYYVYAETQWMDGAEVTTSSFPTLYLNSFTFTVMEGTTISLIDQSLLFFPDNNANSNRLNRTIPGFDITFGGGDGAKYTHNGTFIFRNKEANSENQNGSITITPRIKAGTGSASDVTITSVVLNTGSDVVGSPAVYINGVDKGAVTANSTLVYNNLTGNTLTIKLKGTGASNSISFLLNSITFNYTLNNHVELDESKGTVDLRFSNYGYGHTGETAECDLYFDSPVAFYGDVAFWGDNWTFSQASTGEAVKTKVGEKTHFYYNNGSGNGPYRVNIGEGVCHLYASFAETDYFAAAYASTRLYSYDYVEEPSLTLAPGESYTVPTASGLDFTLTATGGGTITLTNTTETAVTADGTPMQTTATGSYVTITNSGSDPVTITRIEVKRLEPELSYSYTGGLGDDGNVFFPGDNTLPSPFTVKEGNTDISDRYESSGTYEILRSVEGVTINASTGEVSVGSGAEQGWLEVQLTVNPKDAYKDLYGPVSKTVRLTVVNGLWDFRTYKNSDHNALNGSTGWSANNYNQARDTEFMEEFILSNGEPLMQAIGLESQYKMRLTWAKNNGDGRLHLFGKGSNEQNRARFNRGGILRVPVKKGMLIEINAYSNGQRSDMNLEGCNDLTNAPVTTFYVDEYSASQYFIANRDGYIDIINPSSNLDLYINYIRLTAEMVFYYGEETFTDPGGTFNNYVVNQGETTLSFERTGDSGLGGDGAICQSISADGTVTQRVGAYGSYEVTVTGSGSGLLAGKTGTYTVHVIGFSVNSPVEKQIDPSLKTTFTPKNDILITYNGTGLSDDELKARVEYSFMSIEASVAYFSGDNLVIEGIGDVVLSARLGAITRTMAYRVRGASLNDEAPVITNTQDSYTVVIQGGDAGSYSFDTGRMAAGMLGDLNTPQFTQNGNTLTITNISGEGGIIPIYASCTYGGAPVTMEGVLTVAYSSHLWNFEGDMAPGLANWTPKNIGSWTDACTFEEPVDASANNVDSKDWCFVRKMGVTHPESSIIYYYTHSVIGTNALVIPETQGLYLRTTESGKQLGIEMDNERINNVGVPKLTNGNYACRNLMILRGGQVIIPKVKPGQWIEVRWTRHQDDMAERVSMQNLCDVNGKYISEIYKIGNCFYNIPGQSSTYMFQVNPDATPDELDADGRLDAVFEVADNIYISIQQIELHEPGWQYNSSMVQQLKGKIDGSDQVIDISHQYLTDGNSHTIEFMAKDQQNAPNAPQVWTIELEGNLTASTGASKTDGSISSASLTYKDGWGKAYVTLTSYSQNMKYVANQNTWVITIGARPEQTYPYTWDFSKYFDTTKTAVGGSPDDHYVEDPYYSDATVADKATDVTNLITNPTIDGNANGWTISRSNGNGPMKPSNDALEFWAWNDPPHAGASFDYYQELNVPNGYYIVSADMYNSLNGEAGAIFAPSVCVYASNGTIEERKQVDIEGTDFNTYSTAAIEVTDGTLRIGVKSVGELKARWAVADNFQLTRIEYDTESTRAHELRREEDTWTESGNNEQLKTNDYDSRKYWSYYVDGAQLASHSLGILPETEGLGFRLADKTTSTFTLDMQNTVAHSPSSVLLPPSSQTFPYTWRNGRLAITGGTSITVPAPGSSYDDYYIYIRCSVKPTSVTNTEEMTDDVDSDNDQYKYHFIANADAVITFSSDADIYQIGVTNILKTMHIVGGTAWATESRNHSIDHALTGHLTTNDANAYTVTYDSYDMETATVALKPIDHDGYVPAERGLVMKLSTINSQLSTPSSLTVPLFYPAVTTAETTTPTAFGTDNLMKERVNGGRLYVEDDGTYTKFILTNVHWKYTVTAAPDAASSATGTWTKLTDAAAAGFYRLHIWGDERDEMAPNTAYLCVPSNQLPTALWNTFTPSSSRKDIIGIREIDTGIEDIIIPSDPQDSLTPPSSYWYTLDGRRLDGKPTLPGIYLYRGKKIKVNSSL